VVELVDTQDLGSCAFGCEGSSPSFGTVFNGSGPTRSPLRSGSFVAPGEANSSVAAAIQARFPSRSCTRRTRPSPYPERLGGLLALHQLRILGDTHISAWSAGNERVRGTGDRGSNNGPDDEQPDLGDACVSPLP
jgi:hypothetical protein